MITIPTADFKVLKTNSDPRASAQIWSRFFDVIPIHSANPDGKCSCLKHPCGSKNRTAGKHPRTVRGLKDGTQNPVTIDEWWEKWPNANLAICTGEAICVIDVDGPEGENSLKDLISEVGPLPESLQVKTGRGRHLYFCKPYDVPIKSVNGFRKNLDRKTEGGYIITSPSVHLSGRRYEITGDCNIIADLPTQWLQLFMEDNNKKATSCGEKVYQGRRNTSLTSIAGKLRSEGRDSSEIFEALRPINADRCVPPLHDSELRRIANSIAKYPSTTAKNERKHFQPKTIAEQIAHERRLISSNKIFYQYNDGVYLPIADEKINQETIRIRGNDVQANQLTSVRTFLNTLCFVEQKQINPPDQINLKNGILELNTGVFKFHTPKIPFTIQSPTTYNPESQCPLWEQTITEILPNHEDRLFLQKVFGYCLTGITKFQVGFMFYGLGGNGKSLIVEILESILGSDNCSFLQLKDFSQRFRIVELENKLVNIASEVKNEPIQSDLIKKVIEGSDIYGERKFQNCYTFKPRAKLIVTCNSLPRTTDKSFGYFRRFVILPFNETFDGANRDLDRKQKIVDSELSGVLNWALEGLRSLPENGNFPIPNSCERAKLDYMYESDPVKMFIDDHLTVVAGARTYVTQCYAKYSGWTISNGTDRLASITFTKKIKAYTKQDTVKDRLLSGKYYYQNLQMNP